MQRKNSGFKVVRIERKINFREAKNSSVWSETTYWKEIRIRFWTLWGKMNRDFPKWYTGD